MDDDVRETILTESRNLRGMKFVAPLKSHAWRLMTDNARQQLRDDDLVVNQISLGFAKLATSEATARHTSVIKSNFLADLVELDFESRDKKLVAQDESYRFVCRTYV